LLISDRRVTEAFSTLRAVYCKWAWLAGRWLAVDGVVLKITAADWTAGFHWWCSGNKKRTQSVSEYMLVLTLCLVDCCCQNATTTTTCVCTERSTGLRTLSGFIRKPRRRSSTHHV